MVLHMQNDEVMEATMFALFVHSILNGTRTVHDVALLLFCFILV